MVMVMVVFVAVNSMVDPVMVDLVTVDLVTVDPVSEVDLALGKITYSNQATANHNQPLSQTPIVMALDQMVNLIMRMP